MSELATATQVLLTKRKQLLDAQREFEAAEARVAELNDAAPVERSIEEHIEALAPREGFEISDMTDLDRREIARAVIDAWMFGTAWIVRDESGLSRADPMRVEVRDRRMT